jgi:hypothetical protein
MSFFSNDFVSSSSPYGTQNRAVVIQRPPCESISFDWSDFPVVQQQDAIVQFPSCPPIDVDVRKQLQDESSTYELSSCASDSDLSLTSSSTASNNNKRVSFSNTLRIRTHSIVVGDHPCCPILALELGWEYNDDIEVAALKEIREQDKHRQKIRRWSYMERKNLLRRVSSGIAYSENNQERSLLRPPAPSRHLCDMDDVWLQ